MSIGYAAGDASGNPDGGDGDGNHHDDPPYIVFGYGSLIFRPPPHVIKNSPGFLKGYVRRFAQKSHDHRGTPQNPGRVVTLVHQADWAAFSSAVDPFPDEDIVWGIAYTIDPAHEAEVRAYLGTYGRTISESGVTGRAVMQTRTSARFTRPPRKGGRHHHQDGYTLERVDVYGLIDGLHETVVMPGVECYVGRNDNPSFIASEPLGALSDVIWNAVGPSGPNKDYVYNLAAAVRALAPEAYDSHLFALEARLRDLDRESASTEGIE